jgi:hypothetical protein
MGYSLSIPNGLCWVPIAQPFVARTHQRSSEAGKWITTFPPKAMTLLLPWIMILGVLSWVRSSRPRSLLPSAVRKMSVRWGLASFAVVKSFSSADQEDDCDQQPNNGASPN